MHQHHSSVCPVLPKKVCPGRGGQERTAHFGANPVELSVQPQWHRCSASHAQTEFGHLQGTPSGGKLPQAWPRVHSEQCPWDCGLPAFQAWCCEWGAGSIPHQLWWRGYPGGPVESTCGFLPQGARRPGQCQQSLTGHTATFLQVEVRIALSNNAEHLHCVYPLGHQLPQPLLLLLGASNEATQVTLPPWLVNLEAKALKGLAGSVFVLSLADVVQFSRLREAAVLRPKLHKEVESASIGQCLTSCTCIAVPWL